MKPEEFVLFDLHRLAMGQVPPHYLLEILVRITFLYVVLVVAMRIMGRRVASGLTRNELLAVAALAGAIGPAVQSPERGLLPPVLIAILVVTLQRLLARLTRKSGRVETLLQGSVATLVSDGRMHVDVARKNGISRDLLLAQVRVCGAEQLGEVERLYLEEDGSFTVLRNKKARPGLSVVPSWDHDLLEEQNQSAEQACTSCGATFPDTARPCTYCGAHDFVRAVR